MASKPFAAARPLAALQGSVDESGIEIQGEAGRAGA